MASIDIKVPDIGDFKDVAVIEVLVKPGDTVKAEQSLITVESDKASMEIPSSHAGTVKELKVKLGDTVNQGTVILVLEAAGASAMTPAAAPSASAPAPVPAPAVSAAAAPAAASYAGGADLECDMLVLGAGPGGYSAAFRAADLGSEDGARRALRDARRRVPECRLHPEQGAAARGRGDGRSQSLSRPRCHLRQAANRPAKLLAHKNKVVGKLTGGLAAMAKMRKVTVVRATGEFADPASCAGRGDGRRQAARRRPSASRTPSSPPAPRR